MKKNIMVSLLIAYFFALFQGAVSARESDYYVYKTEEFGYEHRWMGNSNLLWGKKYLNGDDWPHIADHEAWEFETDFKKASWPLRVNFFYSQSSSENRVSEFEKFEAKTREIGLGAKKVWAIAKDVEAYGNGGLTHISAELKRTTNDSSFIRNLETADSNSGPGAWLGGGAYWIYDNTINLGADLRYSFTKFKVSGGDRNPGGLHMRILAGIHW